MGFFTDLLSDMVEDAAGEKKKTIEAYQYGIINDDEFWRRLYNVGFDDTQIMMELMKLKEVDKK